MPALRSDQSSEPKVMTCVNIAAHRCASAEVSQCLRKSEQPHKVLLVLRSLKGVYKTPTIGTVFGLGSSPDPGPGAGVELGGGHPGGAGDLIGAGEVLPGQRLAPEDPPPAFLEIQPAGALGDEGVPDAGMVFQPGPGALAVAAGEVAGDHVDHALGVGLLLELEEVLVEGAVAGRGAQGDRLPVSDAQPAVHPGLLRPAGV